MLAGVVVVGAGCFDPIAEPACSVVCGPDDLCPGGMSCSNGLCSNGPTCLDEDRDRILDMVDSCPGVANARVEGVQPDGDGDGVGDACDPNPTTPGDEIAVVELFGTDLGTTTTDGGWSWTPAGAAISPAVPSDMGSPERTLVLQAIPARLVTLEVGFEVVDLGPDDGVPQDNDNLIALHLDAPAISGVASGLCRLIENNHLNNTTDLKVGPPPDDPTSHETGLVIGTRYLLRLWQDAAAWNCKLSAVTASLPIAPPAAAVSITPSLSVQSMQIAVHHIVVYRSP